MLNPNEQPIKAAPNEEIFKIAKGKEKNCAFMIGSLFPEIKNKAIQEHLNLIEKAQNYKDFLKSKSNEEILSTAYKKFEEHMNDKKYELAYGIACTYLKQNQIENSGQKLLEEIYEKLKKSKNKKEIAELAEKILEKDRFPFLPEINRSSDMVEDSLNLLNMVRDKRSKISEIAFYLGELNQKILNWLMPPLKNPLLSEAAHLWARKAIISLINNKKRGETNELASEWEKKKFLDIEKDADIFEELTK
ncbi:MAG: hypothetical protein WC460_02375 [Patescibacteria group bacterium]